MSQFVLPTSSQITRFLFEDLDVCGSVVQLTEAWVGMHRGRGYASRAQMLLGEMSVVASLMGANLKTSGRLTFQAQGAGPISMMVVDCERLSEGGVLLRGMARCAETPHDPAGLEALPLDELLGDGTLLFSLQSEMTDMPYQSQVPLAGHNMAEIFEHFMSQSAQQPARLWLFANDTSACGLFLQTLPPREREENADADGWNRIQQLAATVRAEELMLPPETLLRRLFTEETLRVFDPCPVRYYCPRDEDRVRSMLVSLGRDEVAGLIAEHGEIRIHDEICNYEYHFGPAVLDELFPSAGHTLH
ncbi:MAG: Hsp33 family molecular chaperone HslO [Sterolibacterium sp.]|jgi:molecular chaperone Hsp33|nr:Hsp33 family molecular chaperone HslO [Sterolibacterium sp.]